MNSNPRGKVLMSIGTVLVLFAVLLTGYNIYREKSAKTASGDALFALKELVTLSDCVYAEERDLLQLSGDVDELEIPDYVLYPDMEMPEAVLDGWAYIGYLEIVELGIELPLISEWSYPALNVAPCRYSGSAYANDLVLAAHNYDSHFGRLNELSVGSRIILTDIDGNRFYYAVSLIETLLPTDVKEMTDGDWDLSLFTCTLGGSNRVTVRCEQVDN